jgi:hypothetical protein
MRRAAIMAVAAVLGVSACDLVHLDRSPEGTPTVSLGCNGRECGGACGTCSVGFACDAQGHCQMQAAVWSVTIVGAELQPRDGNSSWDPEGGAPDPRVCFATNPPNELRCSQPAAETLAPTWNLAAGTYAPTDLMRGMRFKVEDVDDLVNDTVADCQWVPDRESFRRGTNTVRCPGANIVVRVAPL